MTPIFPMDLNKIRLALVSELERVTGLTVIEHEPETPNSPRPTPPYMGFKFTTPAGHTGGDDDHRQVLDNAGNPTTKWNTGGQRLTVVSFNCYAKTHEQAYNYMALWKTALNNYTTRDRLAMAGIAVWVAGTVADLSQLLNTGYEGRAQMDVRFGVAANLVEDLGEMDTFPIAGTVATDTGSVNVNGQVSS